MPGKPVIKATSVNTVTRTWTSKNGTVFHLKPISYAALYNLMDDQTGKPKIPTRVVQYGGDTFAEEPNPDDPVYKQELADWERRSRYRAMTYAFSQGTSIDVPPDFVEAQKEFFPDAKPSEIRYLYITSLIEPDEIGELVDAITGQTGPTEEGIAEAVARFPSQGKRG